MFFCQLFCWFQTQFLVNLDISTVMRSAALGQISTFGPPFDAPGSEVSSAPQIKEMRHFWKSVRRFFWKLEQNRSTNCRSTDCTYSYGLQKSTTSLSARPNLITFSFSGISVQMPIEAITSPLYDTIFRSGGKSSLFLWDSYGSSEQPFSQLELNFPAHERKKQKIPAADPPPPWSPRAEDLIKENGPAQQKSKSIFLLFFAEIPSDELFSVCFGFVNKTRVKVC